MLAVSDLSLERYFQAVFEPLSFTVNRGEAVCITGPNGSGKTTLIRLLAGVLAPTMGSIQSSWPPATYIGHQLAVKDDLSVAENLRFMARFAGIAARGVDSEVVGAIERLGLVPLANRLARTLSAGQRKRCALARLVLGRAGLWLLDEPYANLDDQGFGIVDELIRQHLERGGACVLATHGRHRPPVPGCQELRLGTAPRARVDA